MNVPSLRHSSRPTVGESGYTQDVYAIGTFGLERRERTNRQGITTNRYSITIKSEPVIFNLNPNVLGRGPAEAIKDLLAMKIKAISEAASPSTIIARKTAEKAFAAGKTWATRRYSGGRTGPKAPSKSDTFWNDSGRFAEGLEVRANAHNQGPSGYTINVPANRLDPTTFKGGEAALVAQYRRLVAHVPELADPQRLMSHPSIREAMMQAIDELLISKLDAAYKRRSQLRMQMLRGYFDLASQLAGGITF